jgi:DNA-binding Xre family transcriptional regulator
VLYFNKGVNLMGLDKLNYYKKRVGLTNAQLSEITGITISTIDKITSGNNTNPKLRTIEALCNALGCSLNDIVDRPQKSTVLTENSDNDAKKQRLIKNYELLNEDGQEDLLDYSDMLASNPRKIKESDKNISLNA